MLTNMAITGEAPEYFAEYKIKVLRDVILRMSVASARILDFGSGIGNSIPHVRRLLPDSVLTCADVSQRSLEVSETRFPSLGRNLLIKGERIPVDDNSFDVTFSACVFHHIPHDEHVHWLSELFRVTRHGGVITVFEHNPLNPLTLRAVNTCPFDANARLIRASKFVESYRKAGWQKPRRSLSYILSARSFSIARSGAPFGLGGNWSSVLYSRGKAKLDGSARPLPAGRRGQYRGWRLLHFCFHVVVSGRLPVGQCSWLYAIGFGLSFLLNRTWTFRYRGRWSGSFARWSVVGALAYGLNFLTVVFLHQSFGLGSYLVQVAGVFVYTVVAFFGARFFAFRDRRPQLTMEPI